MNRIYQKTLSEPVSFEGVGVHSGKRSKIKILPGNNDSGILFKRVDLLNNNLIEAHYMKVSSTTLSSTLQNKFGVKVRISLYFNKAVSLKVSVPNEFNK